MPVRQSYADRVFTTLVVSYPEMVHIGADKDFTPVIEKALELGTAAGSATAFVSWLATREEITEKLERTEKEYGI